MPRGQCGKQKATSWQKVASLFPWADLPSLALPI